MRRGRRYISDLEVLEIKRLLWHGMIQVEIAEKVQVSQGAISQILHGRTYRHVPWPDGSTGGMPEIRLQLRKMPTGGNDAPFLGPIENPEIRRIADEAARIMEADDDRRLLEIIRDHGNETPDQTEVPESIPIPFDEPRWKIYEQVEADNPLVKEAKEGDECQKIAVITTFDGLDEEKWNSPLARTHYEAHLRTIRQLKKGSP